MRADASPELNFDDPKLIFFRSHGLKDLIFSMVKQSIQDIVAGKAMKDVGGQETDELRASADWLKTQEGQQCLIFLMPDASASEAVARIYANPEEVLASLKVDSPAEDSASPAAAHFVQGFNQELLDEADDIEVAGLQFSPT